uniref:Chromosome segregation protein SMC n=1 Tax=Macrostomum lignano TaxID=282301 RepID=A0A1I8FBY9_9PLAT
EERSKREALDAERERTRRGRVAVLEREIDTASRRLAERSKAAGSNGRNELEIKLKEAKNRLDESSRLLEEESRRLKATEAEADRVEAKADAAETTLAELTRTLADESRSRSRSLSSTRFAEALERGRRQLRRNWPGEIGELERLQEDCRKQDAMAADIESELQAGLQVLERLK